MKILSNEGVSRPCQCTTSKIVPKVPRQTAGMKDPAGTGQTREQDVDCEERYPGFPGWLTNKQYSTAL